MPAPKRIVLSKIGESNSGLTDQYAVSSGRTHLGWIRWYAPWRKYTYYPAAMTLYDGDCLDEISGHVKRLTQEHKAK